MLNTNDKSVSTSELEEYASKKQKFTTKQAARDLKVPERRLTATLANRMRHGRRSQIRQVRDGSWEFQIETRGTSKQEADLGRLIANELKKLGHKVVAVIVVQQ